jgi:ribosomal protein S18 acetylase RimI-like enzyme
MRCYLCDANAQYRDSHCGQYVCLAHSRLQVAAQRSGDTAKPPTVRSAEAADRDRIAELALYFWDEVEVECFDHEYDVRHLPAFVVCDDEQDGQVVGLASYAVEGDALNLVMLNVLPGYQGRGAGQALIAAVEKAARARSLSRIVVATSNDDLPALYFYQRRGFRLTGLAAGRLVEHHSGEEPGFAGIPVRDEIQLEKRL